MRYVGIILFTVFISCSTANVVSFYNEREDFSKYTTFRIVNPANRNEKLSEENQQSDERLENAIKKEMDFRGYTYDENSTLKVYYRILLDNNSDVRVNDNYPYRRNPYTIPYATVQSYDYKEGILMIEMKDAESNKTLFQGSLDLKIKSRSKVDVVSEAMRQIFEEYPFRAGDGTPRIAEDS